MLHTATPIAPAPVTEFEDAGATADYDRVRKALAFITERWRDQPSLDEIAARVGVSPSHLHHIFRRWAGITPKAFLQAITLDHARGLLRDWPACSKPPTRSASPGRRACTICS